MKPLRFALKIFCLSIVVFATLIGRTVQTASEHNLESTSAASFLAHVTSAAVAKRPSNVVLDAYNVENAPNISQPSGVTLNPSGTSTVGWMFDTTGWSLTRSHGQATHVGDDHYAHDWARGCGQTAGQATYAGISGVVVLNPDGDGDQDYYGNTVVIYDDSTHMALRYAHLREFSPILFNGYRVSAGQYVGTVGNTGNTTSTTCTTAPGAHLHIVLYKNVNTISSRPIINTNFGVGPTTFSAPFTYTAQKIHEGDGASEGFHNSVGGPPIHPNGTLIRARGQSTTYLIVDGKKRGLTSQSVLNNLYQQANGSFDFGDVVTVDANELELYPTGSTLSGALPSNGRSQPDGRLIRQPDGNRSQISIVTNNGRRRPFASENMFLGLGYLYGNVHEAPDYYSYPELSPVDVMLYVTSSLELIPAGPYPTGSNVSASFWISNRGTFGVTVDSLTVGGRRNGSCDGGCPDFPFTRITLNPNDSFEYTRTRTLSSPGSYDFFVAYTERDGSWNTNPIAEAGIIKSLHNLIVSSDVGGAPDEFGPSLSITSHSSNQTVTNSSITLSGTASDAGRGESGISSVTVNGVRANGDTATGSGTANWSINLSLAEGSNTITVRARDASPAQNLTQQTLTITRSSGSGCSYSLSSSANTIGPGTGAVFIQMDATSGCSWSATSDSPSWLTTSSSGTGDGRIQYDYNANSSTNPRTGRITAGGQVHTVTQIGIGGGGSVQFSAATYNATEGGGVVTITVTRQGGTHSGSVSYATSDGTAIGGVDYTPTSGLVVFGTNQTSNSFDIPILNDAISEGNKTINLSLTIASLSFTLGNPNTATVTIIDDDSSGSVSDQVWVEDSVPTGATTTGFGEGWNWISSNPSPFSGSLAHQSNIVSGLHNHYFQGATQTLTINTGEKLFAYVFIDPSNVPSELMLQWNDGSVWRNAYWGADNITTVSRTFVGPLPASGQWVRLEVAASVLGLEGKTLSGMAFNAFGGRVTWDRAGKTVNPTPDHVWVEDSVPTGATTTGFGEGWNWISSNPSPFSGSLAHQSNIVSGLHNHYFQGATQTLTVNVGEKLFAYVYIDPNNVPSELMLQWNDGSVWRNAYWGADNITSVNRTFVGPLPASGEWVRLEVAASVLGLEGKTLSGMAFNAFGGRVTWDRAGKTFNPSPEQVWVEDNVPTGATTTGFGEGWNWISSSPSPFSGSLAHQSNIVSGLHNHYFQGATQTLTVNTGERLFAYVFIDPNNVPSELMLQWNDGSVWYNAYWGADNITSVNRTFVGPLPASGEWVRLEVAASVLGLEGKTLSGMAFNAFGGRVTWDRAGKRIPTPQRPGQF